MGEFVDIREIQGKVDSVITILKELKKDTDVYRYEELYEYIVQVLVSIDRVEQYVAGYVKTTEKIEKLTPHEEGRKAAEEGKTIDDNPHSGDYLFSRHAWIRGFEEVSGKKT